MLDYDYDAAMLKRIAALGEAECMLINWNPLYDINQIT